MAAVVQCSINIARQATMLKNGDQLTIKLMGVK